MKHKKRRTFFEFLREVLFASQAEREFYHEKKLLEALGSKDGFRDFRNAFWSQDVFRDFQSAIKDVKSATPETRENALKELRKSYVPLAEKVNYSRAIRDFVSKEFARVSAEDKARVTAPLNEAEKAISLAPIKPIRSQLNVPASDSVAPRHIKKHDISLSETCY